MGIVNGTTNFILDLMDREGSTFEDALATATELGYATTIHGAQGLSVDTAHGLLTGEETRQQLYTLLTRGADANHLYVQVVGDGDPHDITRPDNVRQPTATDILESILGRDDGPVSATTTAREHASPALRLGAATARYVDALHVAAEHHLGATAVAAVEVGADRIVPGIGDDAWPMPDAMLDALTRAADRGARVASICTGAFVLAAAGLLDGRRATTHWRYAGLLARSFPNVTVDPDVLFVDDGDVLTSAGVAAGIDLCLHLVRSDHGAGEANAVARRIVVAGHREGGQSQFVERPLPAEPGGGVFCVSAASVSAPSPLITSIDRIQNRTASPTDIAASDSAIDRRLRRSRAR